MGVGLSVMGYDLDSLDAEARKTADLYQFTIMQDVKYTLGGIFIFLAPIALIVLFVLWLLYTV